MTKKVVITLIVLGILLFVVIVLHVLSIFSSFTLFGLEEEQYKVLVADAILALAFVMALVPLLQMRKSLRKLREDFKKDYKIDSAPINNEGVDDIEWMLPYYQKAQRITIFAGGFAWLGEKQDLKPNQKMKKRILKLAGEKKLDLISYHTRAEIEKEYKEKKLTALFEKLKHCFKYKSGLDQVVCTLIQHQPTEWQFLYKGKADKDTGICTNYALGDSDKNRGLLHILSEFTNAEHWDEPATTTQPAAAEGSEQG